MSLNHVPEKVIGKFRIKLMPSMFTARNGKTDIVIRAINPENWGACIDGKFYTICLILAHEDHHIVIGSRYFCDSLFWASQPKQAAKT